MTSVDPRIDALEGEAALAARPAIAQAIHAFNDAASGADGRSFPLALVVREPGSDDVAGGLWGIGYYGWLFIELLVLPEAMRGRGLGTALMDQAEAAARSQGCIGVWLDTFSFQARGFYEKRGYAMFGCIDGYPPGQSRYWMKKALA